MIRKVLTLIPCVAVLVLAGSASAGLYDKGTILFEWFNGTTGGNLDQFVDGRNPNYPDNPSQVEWRAIFQGPTNRGDNYGTHVRGYLYPPADGSYTFWISSDDHSRLWLSTDDNPANKSLICQVIGNTAALEWTKYPEQQSQPVTLQAGKKYYIEALHRDGTGGDNLAVGWGGPVIGTGPVVIAGEYLSPFIRAADFKAANPGPADGGQVADTWATLTWSAGLDAVSHDVYFGDNSADVDSGAGSTFRGNQTTLSLVVGIVGFPFPEGLNAGATYYWRVDEITPDGVKHKGSVWSFSIPTIKAQDPTPADGAGFINVDATLSWAPGFGAKLHYVYFSQNRADVEAGAASASKGAMAAASYNPGALATGTVYYWRVDEFDGLKTIKGDVWSFRTRPTIPVSDPNLMGLWMLDDVGSGTVIDFSGNRRDGTIHGNAQFAPGYDGDAMRFDGLDDYVNIAGYKGVLRDAADNQHPFTICAWVNTTGNGVIMTWGHTSGRQRVEFRLEGGRLRVEHGSGYMRGDTTVNNGQWRHVALVVPQHAALKDVVFYLDGRPDNFRETSNPDNLFNITSNVDVLLGTRYTLIERWFTGLMDDARLYNKALTQAEIQEIMVRPDPLAAWGLRPANASTSNIDDTRPMRWSAGHNAVKHDLYFGTDAQAVASADTSDTTGIYRGRLTATDYTPPETLEYLGTYYWRIDEVEADNTTIRKGRVNSFTVADFIVIDGFEDYNDYAPDEIWRTWVDGFGTTTNGAAVGNPEPLDFAAGEHYAETTIVHSGRQAMPYFYKNAAGYSEAKMTLSASRDWTRQGVKALSLWFRGYGDSVGSFTEGPAGTYTMTATGADIWGTADQFHFAFKQLSGPGSIVAKVERVLNTDVWAKAGVMIRQSLDAGSVHGMMIVSPASGVAFQRRLTADAASVGTTVAGIRAPQWVKVERDAGGNVTGSYSADGVAWTQAGSVAITMTDPVYIGLALTSHDNTETCEAVFSNVQITGPVGPQWSNQDIGIPSNAPERMYVAVTGANGPTGVVYHSDPAAAKISTWTEWNIDLQEFANQGVNLTNVASIAIGFGDKNNPKPGGSGKMYFDDVRLYRPRCMALLAKPAADLNNDCVVDRADVEIMVDNWLIASHDVTAVAPSPANLDAHYLFDGNLLDSSGNNRNGDPCGVVAYTAGVAGQAIELRGTSNSSFVNVPGYAGVTGTQSRTVCAWIKTHLTGEMASWGQNVAGQKWLFRVQESNGVIGAIRIEVNGGYVVGTTDLRDNQWHHVAAVLTDDGSPNANEIELYVDGVREVLSASDGEPINTAADGVLRIGESPWHTRPFTGLIDDLRVYSRAISQAELANLAGVAVGSTLHQPLLPLQTTTAILDLDGNERIDFADFAALADQWLHEQLWP